jgi:hypothetical protein
VRSSRLMKSNLTNATCGTEGSRGLSGRPEVMPVDPGHRPSASALGYALPARWAGFVRRSNPSGGTGAVALSRWWSRSWSIWSTRMAILLPPLCTPDELMGEDSNVDAI